MMTLSLLPAFPENQAKERFEARLLESSWRILDTETGEQMGKARYTVEIQARWAAEAMSEVYRLGVADGARRALDGESNQAEGI